MNPPSTATPSTHTITGADLCLITGQSDGRHRQLAQAGYFPPPICGEYQTIPTLTGLLKYRGEQLRKKNDNLRKEQQRLTKSRADISEWTDAQNRGEYIRKSVIGPALRNISLHQRATLLRKFEQELSPKLAGRTTIEILSEVRAACDEICRIFSDSTRKWADAPPAAPDQPA